MVIALYRKLVTLLERIRSRHDSIELWVIPDHETSCTQKYTLSLEEDLEMLKELLSTSAVLISGGDLQKLGRAGLAHLLYDWLESDVSYIPQQMELNLTIPSDRDKAFMTFHKAEE